MVRGMDVTKTKKKPWKTRMERDIILHKDIKEAYLQGGKAIGEIVQPKEKRKNNKKWQTILIGGLVVNQYHDMWVR